MAETLITTKIRPVTLHKLRLVAAFRGEHQMAVLDRLLDAEMASCRLSLPEPPPPQDGP